MTTIGMECVDAAVIAVRDGVRAAYGTDAATDRFWSDLSVESFTHAEPPESHADLAFAQLGEIWNAVAQPGDAAVFAVPGTMRPVQVGLLLGIARRAGIPVAGSVDAAVAACADLPARATVLHLDVQLYQAVLTELAGATQFRRRRVEVATRTGLKAIHAAFVRVVAEALVRRTRFDPLHEAASERQLRERLPGWLAALSRAESVDAAIDSASGNFTATVRREQFVLAAEAWYAQLAELVQGVHRADEPATLVLSARAALLPALRDHLGELAGLEVVAVPDTAAAATAAARAAEIGPAEPPALVTALSRGRPARAGDRRRQVAVAATHVIHDGRAHAIEERPLVIGQGKGDGRRIALKGPAAGISREHCSLLRRGERTIVRDHSRYGTFVNGERVDGETELGAGDRLRVGTPGVVFELVAVS